MLTRFCLMLLLLLVVGCASSSTGYINLFDECFDSPDFGQLVADTAPAYLDHTRTTPVEGVAHGTPLTILNSSRDTVLVRIGEREVYIPATLISRYNPADGVEHDPSACDS